MDRVTPNGVTPKADLFQANLERAAPLLAKLKA